MNDRKARPPRAPAPGERATRERASEREREAEIAGERKRQGGREREREGGPRGGRHSLRIGAKLAQTVHPHPATCVEYAYRGNSLIRNTHPPRITIGP